MTDHHDTTPSHDLDAEKAVLGSILIKPEVLGTIDPPLTPQDFHAAEHRTIYRHLVALAQNGGVDGTLLADRLRQQTELSADEWVLKVREAMQAVAAPSLVP